MSSSMNPLLRTVSKVHPREARGLLTASVVAALSLLIASPATAQFSYCLIQGPNSAECGTNVTYTANAPAFPSSTFNATFSLLSNSAGASFVGSNSCTNVSSCSVVVTTANPGSVIVKVVLTFPGNTQKTCQVTLTVSDNTPPTITCPPNTSVPCGGSIDPSATGTPAVTDCSPYTLNYTDTTNGSNCAGPIITRTWTATDSHGNSATCVQTITRTSTTSITCPAAVSVQCFSQVPPPDIGSVTASDSCGGPVTVTFEGDVAANGNSSCNNVITRTYKAVNGCGVQATCTQTITVNDTTPPSITCPASVNVQCLSQVPAPNVGAVTASDNCGGAVTVTWLGDVASNGTSNCNNMITRSYRAMDACGNQATCTQTITVNDTTPPTIQCPAALSLQCFSQVPPANTGFVFASDNCGGPVTVTHVSDVASNGTSNCNNVITRTYAATDACGNQATCAQLITVNDTFPPSIQCPGPVSVQCFSQVPPANINLVTAFDNCAGAVTVTHVGDVASNGTSNCNNVITRTYAATDSCGNQATCTQTIMVNDTTPPSIQCPGPVSVQCFSQVPAANIALVTASDNCGGAVTIVHVSDVATNGTSSCNNVITRTYRATDLCGNQATCTQTITVNDTTPPVITCPPDFQGICGASIDPSVTGSATATDNCDPNPVVTHTDVTTGLCPLSNEVTTRTWTATDACNNVATCIQIITLTGGGGTIAGCTIDLGGGCGVPTPPHLNASLSTPPPTLSFSITAAAANAPGILAAQLPPFSPEISLTSPCTLWIDPSNPATLVVGAFNTDPAGAWMASFTPIPITFDVRLQAAVLSVGQPLGLYQLTNAIEVARPGPCQPCTLTIDKWRADTGPSSILYDMNWLTVFPAGMDIGLFNGGAPGFGLHWTPTITGRQDLKTFLQTLVGTPGALTADAINPTSTTTGTLGRLTAVLQLNIAFNAAGLLGSSTPGFGAFIYNNPGDALNGFSVQQILGVCNQVLAGVLAPPPGYSFNSLTNLLEDLQSAFAGCVPSPFASLHLTPPGP